MLDVPDGARRLQKKPVPLGGGVAAWMACMLVFGALWLAAPQLFSVEVWRGVGMLGLATVPLLVAGLLDDRYRLPARWLVLGGIFAAMIALVGGIRIERVSWFGTGALALPLGVSWLVSGVWLLLTTGATKFSDGVDGLVAGQTVVGSLLIVGLSLSAAYFQPDIALIAGIFGASFFGVLLHNWPRARLYLGEFGSTFAGFGLGAIAIVSGAKLAIALAAVGILLVDIVWVMIGRLRRGTPIFVGDRTHIHFLLQDSGLPSWAVAPLLWVTAFGFGFAALQLQTQGKATLLLVLACVTWGASVWLQRHSRSRATWQRHHGAKNHE